MDAQCPRCEARDFQPTARAHILVCGSCGAQTHRSALVHQIACNARLVAEILAERASRLVPLAN